MSIYIPAETDVTGTGELLSDPYLSEEPVVEIGSSSPEFSYEYHKTGATGQVSLIWSHTAGYKPSFMYYYPEIESAEYARVSQQFEWTYDQIPAAIKISASFEILCLGDFTLVNSRNLWKIGFKIGTSGTSLMYQCKSMTNLESNENFEVEFLLQKNEVRQIFQGAVEYEPGMQQYPSDIFSLAIDLLPTSKFMQPMYGEYPWNVLNGGVIVSIDHVSIEALLDAVSQAPPKIQPRGNTSELWNSTYSGYRIEPAGYDNVAHLSHSMIMYNTLYETSIGMLDSDLSSVWNKTIYCAQEMKFVALVDFVIRNNKIVAIGQYSNSTITNGIYVMSFDSTCNSLWNQTLYLTRYDYPIYIDIDTSGNVYIVALSVIYIDYYLMYKLEYSIIKLDNQGAVVWNKTVAEIEYGIGYSVSIPFPTGFGCSGNSVYIGIEGEVIRYDSNGNEIWRITSDDHAMCADPHGGFYTFSLQYLRPVLSKWTAQGVISWSNKFEINYGDGWYEYPTLQKMMAGPKGTLYLVLAYEHIVPTMSIVQVERTGQIISHDTIMELRVSTEYHNLLPATMDMAITGDGLVHLATLELYNSLYIYYPLYMWKFDRLLSFKLSEKMTFSPLSITMVGIASLIFLGIALDYFIFSKRRVTAPTESNVPEFEW